MYKAKQKASTVGFLFTHLPKTTLLYLQTLRVKKVGMISNYYATIIGMLHFLLKV